MTTILPNLKKLFFPLALLLFIFSGHQVFATHEKGGYIYAEQDPNNYLRFKFTLVTYSVAGGFVNQEETLYFGDCTSAVSKNPIRTILQDRPNTQVNQFVFEHIYRGAGTYNVTYIPSTTVRMINLTTAGNHELIIQTMVTADPFLTRNHSPFLNYPQFEGSLNQPYYNLPLAHDADGDSLAFKISQVKAKISSSACGNINSAPVVDHQGLENFLGQSDPNITPGYTLDRETGNITWNLPGTLGQYLVYYEVEEWREKRMIGKTSQIFLLTIKDNPFNARGMAGGDVSVCPGTSFTIGLAPVEGHSYEWVPSTGLSNPRIANPTLTLPTSGKASYVLHVFSPGNSVPSMDELEVTVLPASSPVTISQISPTVLSASGADMTYEWRKDEVVLAGETSNQLAVQGTGNYSVRGRVGEGCYSAWSSAIAVSTLAGIRDDGDSGIRLFPNPASSSLTILAPASARLLAGQMVDQLGKEVLAFSGNSGTGPLVLDVQGLAAGLYLVRLQTDQGISSQRVVVRH